MVDCPDRRLGRAALELAAEQADGETEVSMVLPRRSYGKTWRRILHDQTADHIVEIVSQLPHVNATIIPFHVSAGLQESTVELERLLVPDDERDPGPGTAVRKKAGGRPTSSPVPGTQPIASLQWRTRARVAGRVKTIRVQPLSEVPTIECVVADDSGEAITFVFLGRRSIAGLRSGTRMAAEGMVGKHKGKLAMINPSYEVFVSSPSGEDA